MCVCAMHEVSIVASSDLLPVAPRRPAEGIVPIASGQHGQRPQSSRGRPCRESQMKDGPLVLAVLVGRSNARWFQELSCQVPAGRALAARVRSRLSLASPATDADVVAGLAVLRSWHYVVSSASTEDMHSLMRASSGVHRERRGQRFSRAQGGRCGHAGPHRP